MRILREHPKKPKVSVILLDWGVRESFHTLDYLDRQTVPRSEYEVIWIEFYDRVPAKLASKVEESERSGRPLIEQWVVVGAANDVYFHKHYAYNVGICLAQGRICVICDSDAMYPDNFIARIIHAFDATPGIVLHIDQIRNANRAFYPFSSPEPSAVISDPLTINWNGRITRGLEPGADMLHEANYGACMAASREDLLSIGGADEHIDYLGYICGPYDMTFRLVNFGRKEIWLDDIFLIHTWHPSEGGTDNLGGPQDGRGMSLRALEARASGRVAALVENPAIAACRAGPRLSWSELVHKLEGAALGEWKQNNPRLKKVELPRLVRENIGPFNVVQFDGRYYGFPQSCGPFIAEKASRGEYDCFHHDENLERLIERLRAAVPSESVPALVVKEAQSDRPGLTVEGVMGCNIVLFHNVYFAIPQTTGAFIPEKARCGEYDGLLQEREQRTLIHRLHLRRLAEKDCIASSGLFDRDFYLQCNPDVGASDPFEHFLDRGAAEKRNPNPLFDTQYYIGSCSEVLATGINPLAHFITQGAFEGRRPNWLFDPDYYYRKNLDVAAAGFNPLAHFLAFGAKEGRNPHPLFDTAFYLERNPDVAAAGVNPLLHYLQSGAAEGRSPCVLFDSAYYLEQCRDDETARANPLRHFIEIGSAQDYDPHPLFDTAFYKSAATVPASMDPLSHFLDVGWRNAPSRLFDGAFYLSRYGDVAAAGVNPLVHFLLHGAHEGRWPNPLFNTGAYLARHPDLTAKGVNPLVHFLSAGRQDPTPGPAPSRSLLQLDRRPLVPLSIIIACSGPLGLVKSTLAACRKFQGSCELEIILVGEPKVFGSVRALDMPEVRWEMLDQGGRPRARNLGAEAARHDTLLFLEEGHQPESEDLLRVHASLHAVFPGKDFAVVGKVTDNDGHGADRSWPPAESAGPSIVDYRFFNAANLSMKKTAVTDWVNNGFRSELAEALDGVELAYRLTSAQGLRLLYDPRATTVRPRPLELQDWMNHHRTIGRMQKLLLDIHPEAAAGLGIATPDGQALGEEAAGIEATTDYEAVIEGLREWLWMLHSDSAPDQRGPLTTLLLEICRMQGFLSSLPPSCGSAAARRKLVDHFVERFRQILHIQLVDTLPARLEQAAAGSS